MNNIKVEFGEDVVDGLAEIGINANNEVARGIAKARIEGLWWKAQMGYNDQRCDPEVVAKFAEMIAMECMIICKDVDSESNIDARSGRQDCYCEIRDHFGVDDE